MPSSSSSSKPLLPFFFLVIVLLYCADAHRREVHGNDRIFDISHKYSPNMPSWGSNDGLGQFLWLRKSMKNGSIANSSEMKLPSHSGTHVDAPGHFYDYFFDAGFDVDKFLIWKFLMVLFYLFNLISKIYVFDVFWVRNIG